MFLPTLHILFFLSFLNNAVCAKTEQMSWLAHSKEELLITTYQKVNDQLWSNSCCDDETMRTSGITGLPEQHYFTIQKAKKLQNVRHDYSDDYLGLMVNFIFYDLKDDQDE